MTLTCTPLPDAAEMRALDAAAIDRIGIPGAVLMERAGLAAAAELAGRYPDARAVAIVCGTGNNGGDGLVMARHLHAAGIAVGCVFAGDPARMRGDAARNRDIAGRLGIGLHGGLAPAALTRRLRAADVVVDALLGTGSSGAPRPPVSAAIAAIERSGRPVIAIDLPSGIDGSTGEVPGVAVRADLTIALHAPKVGLVVSPGRRCAGEVVTVDIGIPPVLAVETAIGLARTDEALRAIPPRQRWASKYRAGSVLVVGGSPGYAGAPLLAATAALRAGAGVAWLAVAVEVCDQIAGRRPELMVRALPDGLEPAARAGAVAIGPGLGRAPDALDLARGLGAGHPGPVVIDADALHAFAGAQLASLRRRRVPAVLTPHEGEMGRLLGSDSAPVAAHRLAAVRQAAAESGAVVLLKGPDTLVAAPGGERVAVVSNDVPALATAGSGDVLTGVIAALLARGLGPFEAAVAGAALHGRAGVIAAGSGGGAGIIAGDVIDALPAALP